MTSSTVKFASGEFVPLEMHKVRVVQRLNLIPVEKRLDAMARAGFNTFLLKNHDVFLDMLTDSGMLSCLDANTGKPYYQQERLPKPYNFKSSPVGANGKLYLASEDEDVIVVRMGENFEVLATNTLKDQMFIGTPAIVDGQIYLRGQNTLFAIR